jgi:hypothetical protein
MERIKTIVRRRDLLRFAIVSAGAAAANAGVPGPSAAIELGDKRKARYQANSTEVKNFYRVNKYPAR